MFYGFIYGLFFVCMHMTSWLQSSLFSHSCAKARSSRFLSVHAQKGKKGERRSVVCRNSAHQTLLDLETRSLYFSGPNCFNLKSSWKTISEPTSTTRLMWLTKNFWYRGCSTLKVRKSSFCYSSPLLFSYNKYHVK